MKIAALLCSGAFALTTHAAEDILNFQNDDTLHGEFLGFEDSKHLLWKNAQSPEPLKFKTAELRKIIFQQGLERKPFTHTSLITLTNGDTLPCSILSVDATTIAIETDYIGNHRIEKKHVRSCTLNPLGQEILYHGPLNDSDWKILTPKDDSSASEQELESTPEIWQFAHFSWYNNGLKGGLVLKDLELPKSYRIQFKAESVRNSGVSLIFNADGVKPIVDEDNDKINRNSSAHKVTSLFGSCFALKLNPSSVALGMYSVTKDGESTYTYLKPSNGRSSYRGTHYALANEFEIRADFEKMILAVYSNGHFMNAWSFQDLEIPMGQQAGFYNQTSGDAQLTRISNIVIAPWNGVQDAARSLENDAMDIVLLNNGTDRFSGEIKTLDATNLEFEGAYAQLQIPREDLQSLHFNLNSLGEFSDSSLEAVHFSLGARGRISAIPQGVNTDAVAVKHAILGDISIDPSYLNAISYDQDEAYLDKWNTKLKQP